MATTGRTGSLNNKSIDLSKSRESDDNGVEDDERNQNKPSDKQEEALKKKERKTTRRFTEDILVSVDGIKRIHEEFPKACKFRGRNFEAQDLKRLMTLYKEWAFQLFPSLAFEDLLNATERLGSKPQVRKQLLELRDQERIRYMSQVLNIDVQKIKSRSSLSNRTDSPDSVGDIDSLPNNRDYNDSVEAEKRGLEQLLDGLESDQQSISGTDALMAEKSPNNKQTSKLSGLKRKSYNKERGDGEERQGDDEEEEEMEEVEAELTFETNSHGRKSQIKENREGEEEEIELEVSFESTDREDSVVKSGRSVKDVAAAGEGDEDDSELSFEAAKPAAGVSTGRSLFKRSKIVDDQDDEDEEELVFEFEDSHSVTYSAVMNGGVSSSSQLAAIAGSHGSGGDGGEAEEVVVEVGDRKKVFENEDLNLFDSIELEEE